MVWFQERFHFGDHVNATTYGMRAVYFAIYVHINLARIIDYNDALHPLDCFYCPNTHRYISVTLCTIANIPGVTTPFAFL